MVPRRRARKKHNARLTHARTPAARRGKYRHIAGLAWFAVCCTAWHGSTTGVHPYIPYYNRTAALSCAASGVALVSGMRWRCYSAVIRSSVAQAALYPLLSVWYRGRLSGYNWRYNCIDRTKRTVNACMWLYFSRAK